MSDPDIDASQLLLIDVAGEPSSLPDALSAIFSGGSASLRREGDVFRLELASAEVGAVVLQEALPSPGRAEHLQQHSAELADKDLALDVRLYGHSVAVLGRGSRAGDVARLLKLTYLDRGAESKVVITVRDKKNRYLLPVVCIVGSVAVFFLWKSTFRRLLKNLKPT